MVSEGCLLVAKLFLRNSCPLCEKVIPWSNEVLPVFKFNEFAGAYAFSENALSDLFQTIVDFFVGHCFIFLIGRWLCQAFSL